MPVTNVDNAYTLLTLTGIGVAPYSARGLKQTLEPISQAAQLRRTVNGALVDLSPAQFKKYKSTITGSDQVAPICDGVWPGQTVTVECVAELAYPQGGTAQRTAVSGSSRTEAGVTYYRPSLSMIVTGFAQEQDEWGAAVSWHMDLEEA